jgi:hypothetical protein
VISTTGTVSVSSGCVAFGDVPIIPVIADEGSGGGGVGSGEVPIMPAKADALSDSVNTTTMLSCRSFLIGFSPEKESFRLEARNLSTLRQGSLQY